MSDTLNFAARLIFLKESGTPCDKKKGCIDHDKFILEDDELEMPEVEKDEKEEEEKAEPIQDADEFEECLTDKVFFCANCNKHFIASEDIPDNIIVCPVCNDGDLIVKLGTAEEALEEPENEDVAVEIQDIQEDLEDDIPEEEEDETDEEEDEMFLDEESLDECLTALARKYMKEGKGIRARTLSGKIVEGNLILSGRCNRKGYTITVENFNKAISEASRKVVLSATTDLFNNCKLNIGAIKEGNKLTVKKIGYGMITESANRKVKVTGIIG